jgi:hypothetical protein
VATNELEGNTLSVYAYVAKEGRPVGTRDVTRGANLSSPSVAHRHLLKLEALGLIQKNEYGEYTLREKVNVNGYVWVGRNLVPRLMFYFFFFMGAFGAELAIIVLSFWYCSLNHRGEFLFLDGMTAVLTMTLFTAPESIRLHRKLHLLFQTEAQTKSNKLN